MKKILGIESAFFLVPAPMLCSGVFRPIATRNTFCLLGSVLILGVCPFSAQAGFFGNVFSNVAKSAQSANHEKPRLKHNVSGKSNRADSVLKSILGRMRGSAASGKNAFLKAQKGIFSYIHPRKLPGKS